MPQGEYQRKYKRIEFFWLHTAKTLTELVGLAYQKDPKTSKVEVLKKTIRVYDRERRIEKLKTVYITDPKQIKQFKKRKSKKEVREAKRKGGPCKKKRNNSPGTPYSHREEQSMEHSGNMVIKIKQSKADEDFQQDEPVRIPIYNFILDESNY